MYAQCLKASSFVEVRKKERLLRQNFHGTFRLPAAMFVWEGSLLSGGSCETEFKPPSALTEFKPPLNEIYTTFDWPGMALNSGHNNQSPPPPLPQSLL